MGYIELHSHVKSASLFTAFQTKAPAKKRIKDRSTEQKRLRILYEHEGNFSQTTEERTNDGNV